MMDIITLECPNCGAKVVRQKNEYFATCPYCGVEVCFDEIKGEAAKGQIDELKDSVWCICGIYRVKAPWQGVIGAGYSLTTNSPHLSDIPVRIDTGIIPLLFPAMKYTA